MLTNLFNVKSYHLNSMFLKLASVIKPLQAKPSSRLNYVLSIITGSVFLALLSKCSVYMYPVPLTGQTLALLLLGVTLGVNRSFYAVISYLVLGSMGVPVFASTLALGMFLDPSFGYDLGFAFSSVIMAYCYHTLNCKTMFKFSLAAVIALVPTFAFGLAWLTMFFGFKSVVLQVGLYPFILGEVIKIIVAFNLIKFFNRA